MGKSIGWLALLMAALVWFFHESLFQNHSLVPTDLRQHLMLPYAANEPQVQVRNHYAMDALTTDYPLGKFWQQSVLRDGELPFWNPYILGGHPNLADSMPAVLSPFKLLYLVLPAERAFTLGIILEFALAGCFMFGLLRQLERSRAASFVGACAWMLNSAFLMWYWRSPNLFCWAPLVLWLLERRSPWAGLALGVAMLSGNIQAGAQLGFLCTAYGVGMVWFGRAHWGRVLFILLTGALLAAVQWVPALELMRLDVYGGTQARGAYASLRHTVLGLPALITFVFPAVTGSTESYDLLKVAGASRGDFTGYIGIVPFTLFLTGIVAGRREWRVRVAIGIVVAVLGLVFFTPLVKFLYHRFFVVAVFAMTLIAAYGLDADETKTRRVWVWMSVLCGAVLAGVLAVQLFGGQWMPAAEEYVTSQSADHAFAYRTEWFGERVHEFIRHYRVTNVEFWLPALAVMATGWLLKQGRPWFVAAVVVFTVADLVTLGRRLVPQCDLAKYPLEPKLLVCAALEGDRELFRVDRQGKNRAYILRPNWMMAYGWQDIWGNFSLAPDCVERLEQPDIANVKYVITEAATDLPADHYELLAEAEGARLYRNQLCQPRLRFGSPGATIAVERYTANHVIARVVAPQAGRLVLADTWYPGWRVRVNGQPAELLQEQRVLRAVDLPAGEHRVEFYFASRTIQLGAALSALALAAISVGACRECSRRNLTATSETRAP